MRLKALKFLALVAILAFATAPAYAQGVAPATFKKGEKIKLGWAGDLSLQLIKPSQGIEFGAQIAVNRLNAAGGIKGFQVELVPLDDQCTGDVATTVAQKFASDPAVVGVVGHVCSGATIPASDVYEKARIAMVSGSATAAAVTNRGLDVVNRVVFTDDGQALGVALFMSNEMKATKLAVLDDNQSYGKGLADAVAKDFTTLGGTVTLQESVDKDTKDYKPVLTKMLADPPQVLFFGGYYGPAALIVQQMKEVGLTDTAFFSDDGVYTADFLKLAGKDAEGVYASSVSAKTDDNKALASFADEWAKTFNVKYDDFDPYQPNGFDAALVLINALDNVATVDAASGSLTIDREALIKAVRATKDLPGLTGNITCSDKGECGAGIVGIYKVTDGKFVQVHSYTAAELLVASKAMDGMMAATATPAK